MPDKKWYESSRRRSLVDMHIDDWDPAFLSEYDPEDYVRLMREAHVQSAMFYANSHVGLCYWPTKSGRMHKGLNGRDIVGETAGLLKEAGIDAVAYYSLIYNNWAYDAIPDVRIVDQLGRAPRRADGESKAFTGRYGVCCPNAPAYRAFVREQLTELCGGYRFDGIFLDMTFWPQVCYCRHCRRRFEKETGGALPDAVDWQSPAWRRFQAKREEWMTEFAWFCSGIIRSVDPGIAIEHQYSTAPGGWGFGVTAEMALASDFASGDLYGGYAEQSAVCKLFDSLTVNKPFEYMTSRCYPNLHDHITMKTYEMLALHNFLALAHNGAFLFIDAIDPRGTLNPEVYRRLGEVYAASMPYEQFLTGEMAQDVGIYYSLTAKFDPDGAERRQPHLEAVLGTADCLRRNHIPYGIVTRNRLGQLNRYRTLAVPDLVSLTPDEARAFREYVKQGGSLYASGRIDLNQLGDLFGLEPVGRTAESYTYIKPEENAGSLLRGASERYPLAVDGRQALARAAGCEVLATVALPYTDPADFGRFASIHSNPPGVNTDYPALARHAFGKGTAVWCAAAIEAVNKPPHKGCTLAILHSLLDGKPSASLDGPDVVELLRFDDEQAGNSTIRLVNVQESSPVLPVFNLTVRVATGGKAVGRIVRLPDMEPVDFRIKDGDAEFSVDKLALFAMYLVQFER